MSSLTFQSKLYSSFQYMRLLDSPATETPIVLVLIDDKPKLFVVFAPMLFFLLCIVRTLKLCQ